MALDGGTTAASLAAVVKAVDLFFTASTCHDPLPQNAPGNMLLYDED